MEGLIKGLLLSVTTISFHSQRLLDHVKWQTLDGYKHKVRRPRCVQYYLTATYFSFSLPFSF